MRTPHVEKCPEVVFEEIATQVPQEALKAPVLMYAAPPGSEFSAADEAVGAAQLERQQTTAGAVEDGGTAGGAAEVEAFGVGDMVTGPFGVGPVTYVCGGRLVGWYEVGGPGRHDIFLGSCLRLSQRAG